ncbi:hemerythrin domain-containing protein [Thalassotalea marina]|nr:hemerythrin domain-containing protein [Thalassotalea marina]
MSLINNYFSVDHQKLDCLFEAFISHRTKGDDNGYNYFQLFHKGLIQHIEWEEKILFPFIENLVPMSQGPTSVMCEEHGQIKVLLEIIDHKLASQFNGEILEITQLTTILAAHNLKEENVLYPMIDNNINQAQRAEIFSEMELLQQTKRA